MSTMAPNNVTPVEEQHDQQQQQQQATTVAQDDQALSTVTIAVICVCVAIGVALLVGFCLILRRMRQRRSAHNAGFVTFNDAQSWQKTSMSYSGEHQHHYHNPPPPPETHDLVFNSILEHPPRAPASSHQTNSKNSNSLSTTSMMFEDGYEKSEEDDKILMSLARQKDWTQLYRPSTPSQLEKQQQHPHRISNSSSYHVW